MSWDPVVKISANAEPAGEGARRSSPSPAANLEAWQRVYAFLVQIRRDCETLNTSALNNAIFDASERIRSYGR